MKAEVRTLEAQEAGSIDLPEAIFGLEPRADILHRVVTWQLAKRRAGTHQAKTRGEISLTGKKMYKQKGTGRARHGNARVGLFVGGGKAHGPRSRDHATGLPKKLRALGLKHALSAKAKADELVVLDKAALEAPKTKALLGMLGKLGLDSALIIDGAEIDRNFRLAARNILHVDVLPVQGINVYDILRRNKLVLTRAALEALEARFR